jgi:hypothetical protein
MGVKFPLHIGKWQRLRESPQMTQCCGCIGMLSPDCPLNAQFRPDFHVPLFCMQIEPQANSILPGGMVVFAHRSLLNLAIHILRVRLEGGTQVDVDRNTRGCDQGNLRRDQDNVLFPIAKLNGGPFWHTFAVPSTQKLRPKMIPDPG